MIDKIKAPLRKGKKEAREKRADTIDLVGQQRDVASTLK